MGNLKQFLDNESSQPLSNPDLDGIEVGELVEPLEVWVVEGGDGEGSEVEEVGVGRVALGEDEVLEGDGAVRLAPHPPVRNGSEVRMICSE